VQVACYRTGTDIPLPFADAVVELAVERLPDSPVDGRAAAAVRELHRSGIRVVMAANTGHSRENREQSLADAGIADCFAELVLSCDVGCRKPMLAFYEAVLAAAGCAAEHVLFVGDRVPEDVLGPLTVGMGAVLVHPGFTAPPLPVPDEVPVLQHVAELPELLRAWS
jgi:FMN phosphatase YigB (HAD superfamily)